MNIKNIDTKTIISKFMESCFAAEGDIEKTKVIWSLEDCRLHFLRTINSFCDKYEANVVIRDFLSFCKAEENRSESSLDLSQIDKLLPVFIEQYSGYSKSKSKDLLLTNKTSAFSKAFQKADSGIDYLINVLLNKLGNGRKSEFRDPDSVILVKNVEEVCSVILSNAAQFQRNNDKWDTSKQQEFLFNLFAGYSDTVITLYHLPNDEYNCKILDGLQRLTAIFRLFTDPTFMIPTKPLSERAEDDYIPAKEFLIDPVLINMMENAMVTVKTYCFETELAAVDHYISINNGFTHSKTDIKIALDYRDNLLSE
ncbi:DUF262 domain-containing protein [Photobacterium damselae]|uniref:DUF262 domain-containing protein n=1 Tax=Photobacterium damselae TaxID=38293 RepID=UPI001F3287DC|nr:DUF262 domain-containing protein [Photobacterium damselae]UKA04862.1 DUF262 domain-containing protein [Photobacterium damselae subsp. damselae]